MNSPSMRLAIVPGRVVLTLAGLAFLAVLAPAARARSGVVVPTAIPVANHGFEEVFLPDGTYTTAIPGWNRITGFAGTYNPTTDQFPDEAPEGENVAFLGPDFTVLSQVLSSTLAVGTYTLRVDVGHRLDYPYAGYKVQLLAGGTVLAEDNNSLSPAPGTFVTSTVTFMALAGNPHLGQRLEIRLVAPDPRGPQTDFDDVRLTYSAGGPPAS